MRSLRSWRMRVNGAPSSSCPSRSLEFYTEPSIDRINHESRLVLRWTRHAYARVLRGDTKADGANRLPPHPVARDEVLRALRTQGLHSVPGIQGRRHQELLP